MCSVLYLINFDGIIVVRQLSSNVIMLGIRY